MNFHHEILVDIDQVLCDFDQLNGRRILIGLNYGISNPLVKNILLGINSYYYFL